MLKNDTKKFVLYISLFIFGIFPFSLFAGELSIDFPDYILCEITFASGGTGILEASLIDTDGSFFGYGVPSIIYVPGNWGGYNDVVYELDGTFEATSGGNFSGGNCDGENIEDVIADGRSFEIVQTVSGGGGTSTSGTTTVSIDDTRTVLFNGFVLYFMSFGFTVWNFRRKR